MSKKFTYETLVRFTSEDADLLQKVSDDTGILKSRLLRVATRMMLDAIEANGIEKTMLGKKLS